MCRSENVGKFYLASLDQKPSPNSYVMFEGLRGKSVEKEQARRVFLLNHLYKVRKIIVDNNSVCITFHDNSEKWNLEMFRCVIVI